MIPSVGDSAGAASSPTAPAVWSLQARRGEGGVFRFGGGVVDGGFLRLTIALDGARLDVLPGGAPFAGVSVLV